ncbi:MAG: exopolysaccharide biosynthesis protein [Proteobacteria bacterium]|nr:MAG: exopolysaccharide biosynthesis protein [Pseudomonadota bacterium]
MAKLKVGTDITDEKLLDESPILRKEVVSNDQGQTAPENRVAPAKQNRQKVPDSRPPVEELKAETPDSGGREYAQETIASGGGREYAQETIAPENSAPAKNTKTYTDIDIGLLNRKGFVSKESDNRVLKEQFRAIKRKLINNAFGPLSKSIHFPNLIIVTSCNPHEGKTFSSINLALNIALEQDKTVLLVDSDVVRPSITWELGVKIKTGLTEFLSGEIKDVSSIIYSTNIDNFKFIPAGHPHEQSSELLASEKMHKLTEELATRYSDRIVIFDAPPLLGVNETHVMAKLVGQAVIVVEENKTRLNDIENAVSQLDNSLAIGYLVNKSKGSYKDHYGYGYYYHKQK